MNGYLDKGKLLEQFRAYLEEAESVPGMAESSPVDLHTLFVELAALKNEVRIESRQVKSALDTFRGLVDPLQVGHAALQGELERLRGDRKDVARETLRPLLLELLELRDRMAAALEAASGKRISKLFRRLCRREEELLGVWREGQEMTLRRLDQILAGLGVEAVAVLDRPLEPRWARAVRAESRKGVAHGVVVAELRKGFLWRGELLRPAEVVVNREEGR